MVRNKIALIHYSYPPVIGGVEFTIKAHAHILAKNGHRVKIIAGAGEDEKESVEVKVMPLLGSLALFDRQLDEKLKRGEVPERFYKLKNEILSQLEREIQDVKVCIIHNVMTMHFNLPFTCALDELVTRWHERIRFYFWCHDFSLNNPAYIKQIPDPEKYPWNLLSKFNRGAGYITISKLRQRQLARLFGVDADTIQVIPNGIDVQTFLNLSEKIWNLSWDKGFFESELVMFFPSRMLRRKNYELGIRVLSEMKKRGKKCKFVITAPPDPHNPEAAKYLDYLHSLSRKLRVEEEVIFLYELKEDYNLKLDYQEIKDFYSVCDVLFITSIQEGFGIPLLEAGLKRLPIVCTNIEPLLEIVGDHALKIDLKDLIPAVAEKIISYVESSPTVKMFKRVVACYSWEAIYRNYLKKLVNENA